MYIASAKLPGRTEMKTVIDWASKPEPWCWIGPQFKREVEAIIEQRLDLPVPTAPTALARRRHALGITQVELGALAGINSRRVSAIERGEIRGPKHQLLVAALDRLEGERSE